MFWRKKRNKASKGYTYYEFMTLFPFCSDERKEELLAILQSEPCPMFINGKKVPEDLNGVTYGLLDDLHVDASSGLDPISNCLQTLMGFTNAEIMMLPVEEVYGFRNFITRELERINKLFEDIKVNYSSEEISAGVNELNFGSFGVLDWYAKRMGIKNQNDVRDVAWVRIYTCMLNDTQMNNYERRLNKQYTKGLKK